MSERMQRVVYAALVAGACVGLATVAPARAQSQVDAGALYKKHCALCHGADGASKLPNASFADGVWKHGSTPKEVQASITNGVKGTVMLGFASKLKPAEIEALAAHVRAYDKKLK
jgi:mono/diheme cytochrome c family protein